LPTKGSEKIPVIKSSSFYFFNKATKIKKYPIKTTFLKLNFDLRQTQKAFRRRTGLICHRIVKGAYEALLISHASR
jgi:hypothetical protein